MLKKLFDKPIKRVIATGLALALVASFITMSFLPAIRINIGVDGFLSIDMKVGISVAQAAPVTTLAFHSGFETGDFTEWTGIVGTVSVVEANGWGTPKTGTYALRCNADAATAYATNGGGASPKRTTTYIYIVDAPSDEVSIIGFPSPASMNVRLTTDLYLKLYTYNVQKGSTGTTQLAVNTWYRISVSLDADAANDPCKVYIDGDEEISANTDGGLTISRQLGVITSTTTDIYFDDYARDGVSSTADLGDIRVAAASPNAVGTRAEYDTSSGYTNVDEIPANDADFIEDNGTGQALESYNIPNLADLAGASSGDDIHAVNVWIRGDRDGGGTTEHKAYMIDDGGGYLSDQLAFDSIAWFNWYHAVMPKDSAAWSEARFNALEIGAFHWGGQDQRVHCLVAMVAYSPVGVGEADITNLPTSKAFGVVATSTTYWSDGAEPTWPLVDGDAYFTITNNGATCSITIVATNFTGGVGWTLGAPGENIVRLTAFKEGDGSGNGVTLTTSPQAFIAGLVTNIDWELKMETPTSHTDGAGKTSTITLAATLD